MDVAQAKIRLARLALGSLVAIGTMLLAAATMASAEDTVAPANQWTLSFTPYGWVPFLNGDQTVKGRTVSIDVNPIEVLEHLQRAPWMSYAEARRGPLAFYNDVFYANLGIDASAARTFGSATLSASLGVDFEQAIVEVGGAYEIAKWRSGGGSSTAIDILGGARYWYQDMAINLAIGVGGGGLINPRPGLFIARAGSVDWVDPVIGGRIRHQLAPGQDLVLRADIGGFDVGSQFSWNALAAYSWDIAVRDGVTYSGVLGYRALDVDYEQGSGLNKYEYDVLMHGPIVGLTVGY
jgi:hypothetical protein